ncbi:expressed unknown protein [Seminavis robusta]|uniref:Uncharacterized protein n=1 Tax=Seminavis robusta TaxID=568900 RepID=A0A9N8HB45_9STRA|nr:expressed unknown protein [Seminavis robusta]|eukprot:Sro169_g075220.1 n/a (168) ;mRNA; f:80928-81633
MVMQITFRLVILWFALQNDPSTQDGSFFVFWTLVALFAVTTFLMKLHGHTATDGAGDTFHRLHRRDNGWYKALLLLFAVTMTRQIAVIWSLSFQIITEGLYTFFSVYLLVISVSISSMSWSLVVTVIVRSNGTDARVVAENQGHQGGRAFNPKKFQAFIEQVQGAII